MEISLPKPETDEHKPALSMFDLAIVYETLHFLDCADEDYTGAWLESAFGKLVELRYMQDLIREVMRGEKSTGFFYSHLAVFLCALRYVADLQEEYDDNDWCLSYTLDERLSLADEIVNSLRAQKVDVRPMMMSS